MIEVIVLEHLIESNIEGIGNAVKLEAPVNPPQRYILIEKTGSGKTDYLNRATFAVQSISKNALTEAADINLAVIEAMETLTTHDAVFSCDLNSDYNFTNTATKEYRYQAVFDVYYQE